MPLLYPSKHSTSRAALEKIEADAPIIVNRQKWLFNYIAAYSVDNVGKMNAPFLR